MKTTASMDNYIEEFPAEVGRRLKAMRATIGKHAPAAEERISYGVPTFYLNGNLVHFAAFKHHIGFYPGPSGIAAFDDALSRYKRAKGSVQFPHDQPLPLEVVSKIVKFRVAENLKKKPARRSK